MELRTRRSSSSAFTDSPTHSRHGGSPLHYYLPGNVHKYIRANWKYELYKQCQVTLHLHQSHTDTVAHRLVSRQVVSQCVFHLPVCLSVWGRGPFMLWFLSLCVPGLTAGSESGRSSPYYSQPEPRCTTPTTSTFQAPRHFHVPGRPSQITPTPNPFTNTNNALVIFEIASATCGSG